MTRYRLAALLLASCTLSAAAPVQAQSPAEIVDLVHTRAGYHSVSAQHPPAWLADLLTERAATHGVSASRLIAIVRCESTFNPNAVGDHGSSHGLVQLNDRATGLLSHFRAQGYSDPYSAWESSDYLARVMAGHWASEGVTVRRWSCAR